MSNLLSKRRGRLRRPAICVDMGKLFYIPPEKVWPSTFIFVFYHYCLYHDKGVQYYVVCNKMGTVPRWTGHLDQGAAEVNVTLEWFPLSRHFYAYFGFRDPEGSITSQTLGPLWNSPYFPWRFEFDDIITGPLVKIADITAQDADLIHAGLW